MKIKIKYIREILTMAAISTPVVSFAALDGLRTLLRDFKDLLDLIIPILFGLALVYFFWGVGQFILNDAGNDKTRSEGKGKMIWGVVALFVMLSIWGIINLLGNLIDIPVGSQVNLPNPNLPQ